MNAWGIVALVLACVALGLLAGAAIGYYTAAGDLTLDRARAWRQGWEAGRRDIEWRNRLMGADILPEPYTNNPYAPGKRGDDSVEPRR